MTEHSVTCLAQLVAELLTAVGLVGKQQIRHQLLHSFRWHLIPNVGASCKAADDTTFTEEYMVQFIGHMNLCRHHICVWSDWHWQVVHHGRQG